MDRAARQELLDALLAERFGPPPLPDLPRPLLVDRPAVPRRVAEDPAVTEARRRRLCEAIDGRYLVPVKHPPPRRTAQAA
ncbi:hypothetical protein K1W54_13350 [Micromonospora sp. CPCC 205371]|nr:hypothetical protein [Micromonospora sp. CPCC 205371]